MSEGAFAVLHVFHKGSNIFVSIGISKGTLAMLIAVFKRSLVLATIDKRVGAQPMYLAVFERSLVGIKFINFLELGYSKVIGNVANSFARVLALDSMEVLNKDG